VNSKKTTLSRLEVWEESNLGKSTLSEVRWLTPECFVPVGTGTLSGAEKLMRTLLELRIETVAPAFATSERFKSIAKARGFDVEPIRLPGVRSSEPVPSAYWSALSDATAYWIGDPALLAHDETRKLVEEKLSKGAIAICDVRLPSFENALGASFFEDLGIEPTPVGAFATRYDERYGHPRLIQLSRSEYPMAFRDSRLFRGVQSLLVQGANGIGCSGYAQTVLALPAEMVDVVDLRTDFSVDSFPKPELPIAAISSREDWSGQVIALSTGILHDPYIGPTGHQFPGIEAEDNRTFAENLIRILDTAEQIAPSAGRPTIVLLGSSPRPTNITRC